MTYAVLLIGFLVAFGATALLVPAVRRLALAQGWVDHPDGQRKLHAEPIPAIGGLAIAAGFALGLGYLFAVRALLPIEMQLPPMALWGGALVIVAAGFYDDTRGLGFKGKFVVQVVIAYALLHAGYRIDVSALPFAGGDPYAEALYSIPLTLLWIVGVINAVNLLDGLDGLAAGVSLIAFACLALVFGVQGEVGLILIALLLGGALSAFLLYNFNPASIFMGDSGSLFLGYMLATYSLEGSGQANPWLALLVPAVALGLPVLDTAVSIARRIFERKAVFAPDRDHIHHRLARVWPQRRAVLVLYGVGLYFGLAAVLMSVLEPAWGFSILALTLGLAGVGLNRLGYLRRPYAAPRIEVLGKAHEKHGGKPAEAGSSDDYAGPGGDGATESLGLSLKSPVPWKREAPDEASGHATRARTEEEPGTLPA